MEGKVSGGMNAQRHGSTKRRHAGHETQRHADAIRKRLVAHTGFGYTYENVKYWGHVPHYVPQLIAATQPRVCGCEP